MVPLHDVKLNDVYDDLKRDDHKLEKHIVNEVVNFDTVVASDLSLLVKQPQQYNEVTTVEERHIILCVARVKINQWFDIFFEKSIFQSIV